MSRMAINQKKTTNTNVGEDVKKREYRYTVGTNVNWCRHCGQYGGSSKTKIELSYDPLIPLQSIYLKKQKKLIRKDTSIPYIHTSILYNGQDMEAI